MIINGKKIADEILSELKEQIDGFKEKKPGLVFVLVGDNPSSLTYVNMKKKACEQICIRSTIISLPHNTDQCVVIDTVKKLNKDNQIDGILVQLPLPKHIDPVNVMMSIDPTKDVDGFHPINLGKLLMGDTSGFIPCTPLGIHILLQKAGVEIEGKHVVIVGRSNIVGKPLAALLMQKRSNSNATVTIAHSKTQNLSQITRSADILVAAIGSPQFIKADMVSKGVVVIDVGMNRLKKSLVGDVDFNGVSSIASLITPVPGGVGPMTIACLMKNTVKSFCAKNV